MAIDSDDLSQAAQAIGELASKNAVDTEYDSPYAAEARKAGHDLPWWEKVAKGSVSSGGFKPAQLTVRLCPCHPPRARQYLICMHLNGH